MADVDRSPSANERRPREVESPGPSGPVSYRRVRIQDRRSNHRISATCLTTNRHKICSSIDVGYRRRVARACDSLERLELSRAALNAAHGFPPLASEGPGCVGAGGDGGCCLDLTGRSDRVGESRLRIRVGAGKCGHGSDADHCSDQTGSDFDFRERHRRSPPSYRSPDQPTEVSACWSCLPGKRFTASGAVKARLWAERSIGWCRPA